MVNPFYLFDLIEPHMSIIVQLNRTIKRKFVFMNNFFANRLKCLKEAHGLSHIELALLLGLKSKGTISYLLAGKSSPSIDVFVNIGKLFGVSLNWLIGYTNVPYVNEVLLSYEKEFIEKTRLEKPDLKQNPELVHLYRAVPVQNKNVKNIYLSSKQRNKRFSLEERANILFALSIIQLFSKVATSDNVDMTRPWNTMLEQLSMLDAEYGNTVIDGIKYIVLDGNRDSGVNVLTLAYRVIGEYLLLNRDMPLLFNINKRYKKNGSVSKNIPYLLPFPL